MTFVLRLETVPRQPQQLAANSNNCKQLEMDILS
jgi:hypothetical protein